jgi:hypothetical protein
VGAPVVSTVRLGNESVVEGYKPDEGVNIVALRSRKELGNRVTTMSLSEMEGRYERGGRSPADKDDVWVETPSRAMNLQLAVRFWHEHSDKPPTWVESNDPLLAELIADHFGGIPTKRPKDWKEG